MYDTRVIQMAESTGMVAFKCLEDRDKARESKTAPMPVFFSVAVSMKSSICV